MYGWEVDGEHNALGDSRPPRAAALLPWACSVRKKNVHEASEVSEVSDVRGS